MLQWPCLLSLSIADDDELRDQQLDVVIAEDFSDERQSGPVDAAEQVPGLDGQANVLRLVRWSKGLGLVEAFKPPR